MYTRISIPTSGTNTYQSSTSISYYYTSIKAPITIPKNTPVYVYMPYEFKFSTTAASINLQIGLSGEYALIYVDSNPPRTGSGTFTTSTPIKKEISQNTYIRIDLGAQRLYGQTSTFSEYDYIRWLSNSYLIFGTFTPVVKGNLIKSTDFTAVNQTATVGEKITNSNFTSNTIITADAWNAKWKIS